MDKKKYNQRIREYTLPEGGAVMKKLLRFADSFIQKYTWKELALIKLCMCSLGILVGISIPKKKRKVSFFLSFLAFASTYYLIMNKLVGYFTEMERRQE